jgi:hypothetical protein
MTATIVLALRIGLAVILYLFIWRVMQLLRQDLKQQGSILSSQKKPGIHVDAEMENGRGFKFHFWQPDIVIGRGPHCDITLADEALSVSHARISFHHGQWWLEDLGSTNGTFINKDRIVVPTVIITGDQFKCGNTLFLLRIDLLDDKFPQNIHNGIGGSA